MRLDRDAGTLAAMSLSQSLLVLAVCTAVLPMASLGIRPAETFRDLEKIFVVAMVTLAIGGFVIQRVHGLNFFGISHLLYLVGVITLPLILVGWYVLAFIRRRRTRLLKAGAVVGALLALVGVWGTHIEPNWLQTEYVAVAAPIQQSLTIGVLADLQTPNVGKHEWNAVNTLIDEDPDIVLIPGDFFQGPPDQIAAQTPEFIALLDAMVAAAEVVGVVSGDSDWVGQLKPMAEAAGALFIDNTSADIVVRGEPIRLVGVSVGESGGRRVETLATLTTPVDALTILLSHRPDVVFDLPPAADVDLIVSGHTHGGQISIPFFGPPVTFSDVPRSLGAGGLAVVNNYAVYVSAGVGLERNDAPQVRLGVRPSVGIISMVPS